MRARAFLGPTPPLPSVLTVPLVLASASPRRRDLLARLGVDLIVAPSNISEPPMPGTEPSALVRHLALEKALAVAHARPSSLVLGADTVVVHNGDVLGKPPSDAHARATLRRLAGRTHTVYTGLALVKPADADEARRMLRRLAAGRHCVFTGIALVHLATQRRIVAHEATEVCFGAMTDGEIDAYVATGSPLDKAGAYGIQDDRGALFVRRIEGDYYNVVGLPLHRLYRTLQQHFADFVAA